MALCERPHDGAWRPEQERGVSGCERQGDPWRAPTALLWYLFLGIGVAPENAFEQLRYVADVVTQDALVNSPYFITVGYAAFLGAFCYFKRRACGSDERTAQNAALHLALIGLVAFLPFPMMLFTHASGIPTAHLRHFVYALGGIKMLAWLYLVISVTRYYAFGHETVFGGRAPHEEWVRGHAAPVTPEEVSREEESE